MSTLVELRSAVKTTLAADARLAGCFVTEHGGDFDRHELKRYATRTPAAIVAITRVEVDQIRDGVPWAVAFMCATVLTEDKRGVPKDVSALAVVHGLLNVLCRNPRQFWGLSDVAAPTDVHSLNCYTKEIDKEGVAIWLVSWNQGLQLSPSALVTTTLDVVNAQWDLSPRDNDADLGDVIEAENDIDLT